VTNLVSVEIRAADLTAPGFASVLARVEVLKKAIRSVPGLDVKVTSTSLDAVLAKVGKLKRATGQDAGNIVIGSTDVDAALAKVEALKQAVGKDVGNVVIGTQGLDSTLSSVKAKLAAHGIADLMDVNLPQGQIDQQLLLLKRKIGQAKVGDLLDFNVDTSQITGKLADVERKVAGTSIPLHIVAQAASLNLPKLGETQNIGIGGGPEVAAATAELTNLAAAEKAVADGAEVARSRTGGLMAAQLASIPVLTGAGGGWLGLNRDVTLFAGLLGSTAMIGAVRLWHIALDGVLETTIALGLGTTALGVGIASMVNTSKDIYTHLKSVQTVNSALGSQIPPLTGQFQALSQAMAPQTIEAYGGALNLLNNNSGAFARTAHQVVTGIDDVLAKLDLWNTSQKHTGALLQDGVNFLHQFAQMAGNVFLAVDNLVKADPGTAHFLMDVVVGASKVLEIFTKLPTPILYSALAVHSFMLWGGLLSTWAANIGIKLASAGLGVLKFGIGIQTAARDAQGASKAFAVMDAATKGLAVNPMTWLVAAAAGVAYLGFEMNQASAQAKTFIADLETSLSNTDPQQLFSGITSGIAGLDQQITATLPKITGAMTPFNNALRNSGHALEAQSKSIGGFFGNIGDFIVGMGKAAGDFFPNLIVSEQATNSVKAYQGEIVKLSGAQQALFGEFGSLTRQGFSVQQALGLMSLAGVKWNDTADVMKQKTENLITGYRNMSVSGSTLSNAVNAVSFQSLQQSSNVQQLTQSWDAFLKMITGGQTSLSAYGQQITAITQAASGAATTLTISNGRASASTKLTGKAAAGAAVDINGLSSSALQLRSSFAQGITDAGNMQDALTNMAAAAGLGTKGTDMLTQADKDMVAQLLPLSQGSKAATAELYALAQQGGYQGADSFKQLALWAGNVKNPMQNLDSITTKLTVDSANLIADVQNLSTALGTNLNQSMASAIVLASGGQKSFDNFAAAVLNSHGNMNLAQQSADSLASQLLTVLGNAAQAKNEFEAFAVGGLRLAKTQAGALWDSFRQQQLDTASAKAGETQSEFEKLANQLGYTKQQADNLWDSLHHLSAGSPYGARIDMNGSGQYTITGTAIAASQGKGGSGNSAGGLAAGGVVTGGIPGRDSVPIMAMPGEVVVPTQMVNAGAVDHLRGRLPGFGAGGVVGNPGPGFVTGMYDAFESRMTAAMITAMEASMRAAETAAVTAARAAARKISQHAAGGTTTGGWIGVGEHGPELIKVPGGSTVIPHGQAAQMVAGGAQASALIQLEVTSGGQGGFDDFMSTWIKNYVRVKGGGVVQKAFGRN
jgi:hypothetical protein